MSGSGMISGIIQYSNEKGYQNGQPAVNVEALVSLFSDGRLKEDIQDEEVGEGGQFNGKEIQEDLQKLFDKWF